MRLGHALSSFGTGLLMQYQSCCRYCFLQREVAEQAQATTGQRKAWQSFNPPDQMDRFRRQVSGKLPALNVNLLD
jgi:hypothetical protein